jgi:hypothetical protein
MSPFATPTRAVSARESALRDSASHIVRRRFTRVTSAGRLNRMMRA